MNQFNYFHGHFYFRADQLVDAQVIRQRMMTDLPQLIRVFPAVPREVGPHPLPMFEFHFRASDYEAVKTWLEQNRNNHTVFIHPLSGNEMDDHTVHAEFLGEPMKLNLEILESLIAAQKA